MYDYIKGEVVSTDKDLAILETGGIGYRIHTTSQSLQHIRAGETAKLYCQFVVREDAHMLYGFITTEEREMFVRLTGVSGIGPKAALAVLSAMKISELAAAIITSDETALQKVPGIGKKTAQRIIIDLAEKIGKSEIVGDSDMPGVPGGMGIEAEALAALVALGYNRAEAMRAVASVKNLGDTTEELILMALKRIGA
jgi:Holliday junction DNA helicase RuvA